MSAAKTVSETEAQSGTDAETSAEDFNEKQSKLASYLEEKVADGKIFFKSKFMTDDLGMSTKEIGSNMLRLAEEYEGLSIQKWSYSGATTWRVEKEKGSQAPKQTA